VPAPLVTAMVKVTGEPEGTGFAEAVTVVVVGASNAAAGVGAIHAVGLCTICDERFFSHRREGGVTGRQAAIVRRR